MKKILLTSLSFMALGLANAQLTNLGFETWSSGNPTGWTTLNAAASGSLTQITTGAPEGSSAAAANVVSCPLCGLASLPDPFPGFALQTAPYTARPTLLTFKWKGNVSTGDTALAGGQLSLYPTIIGDALFQIMPGTNQTTWQTQTVTVTYFSSSNPDSALLGAFSDQFIILSGVGSATIGTHVDVDDFVWSGGTVGYDLLETDNSLIVAYPNPASSQVNFNLLGTNATSMEIVDLSGKTVYTENNLLVKHVLFMDGFVSGSYVVRFYNDNKEYVGSTKLNVVK